MAMSAPPPLPGSLTLVLEAPPTYEVLRFPNRSTSAPPMKPRSTRPCAISAITLDILVAHSAPATFGGSPIVPRNFSAGASRMRPTSNRPRAFGAWLLRATAYARIGSRMPTKTRSPSRISREATATISSCGVYALLIRKVGGSRKGSALHAQRIGVDPLHVLTMVRHVKHPLLEPRLEAVRGSRLRGVLAEEGVVSFEVALHGRRVGAA